MADFASIGLCAALFRKETRQALFDIARFRILYMSFFAVVLFLLGFYLGLFENSTLPLLTGVLLGGTAAWTIYRVTMKQKSKTP